MTPCRLRKKSRNSLKAIQARLHPQMSHSRGNLNKLVRVKNELSKTKVQYICDKLEATCSFTNQNTVINPDAPTEVRQVLMETPFQGKVKIESTIDEAGDRMPDHDLQPPGDKREPSDNNFGFLLRTIQSPKEEEEFDSSCIQMSNKSNLYLEMDAPITNLLTNSMKSVDSDFELNKTASLRIDFTPNDLDKETSTKCLDFWTYLKTRDDLKHLCQYPKEDIKLKEGELITDEQKITTTKVYKEAKQIDERDYPAFTSMIKYKNMKGLMPINNNRYTSNSFATLSSYKPLQATKREEAKSLCVEMDEFDKKHPRSLESPGHPLSLSTVSTVNEK